MIWTFLLLPFLLLENRVSILLEDHDRSAQVQISGEGPVQIQGSSGSSYLLTPGTKALLVPGEDGIRWESKLFSGALLRITPEKNALIRVGNKRYRGNIRIERLSAKQLRVFNDVDLEHYLRGVVGSEIPKDSAPEALCAQAIAARSYALAELALRTKNYLSDGVASQVYGGVDAEDPRTDRAVAATSGLILQYAGEGFMTYFHSTCGGHTGDPLQILGENTCPPLRGVACGYCSAKNSKYYSWKAQIPKSALDSVMKNKKLGTRFSSLAAGQKDPWGRWTQVKLRGIENDGLLRGDLFRAAINEKLDPPNNLRSLFITEFQDNGESLSIQGRGWGHGVGMCQIGAIEMAKLGFTYEQILSHYYPGAKLAPLAQR